MGNFIREPMAVPEVMRCAWQSHRGSGWTGGPREPFANCLRRAWECWRRDRANCIVAEAECAARYAELPAHLTDADKREIIALERQIIIDRRRFCASADRDIAQARARIECILAEAAAAQTTPSIQRKAA